MIGLMSEAEIDAMLARHQVGRLGCTANDRPYVVPVNYVYDGSNIYCYSAPGRKIDTMREQPLVAFEVDEIESDSTWRCVIIEGTFHELAGRERKAAIERFNGGGGLVPRSMTTGDRMIVYRISLDERSGRFEARDS